MGVFRTCIHFQFFDHGVTQGAFGQHAFHGFFQCAAGEFFLHLAEGALVDAAGEAGVAVVFFAFEFVAGYTQFVGVDDDDVVAGVNMRGVLGLVFAAQAAGDFGCYATEDFVLRVDNEPFALHLVRFG